MFCLEYTATTINSEENINYVPWFLNEFLCLMIAFALMRSIGLSISKLSSNGTSTIAILKKKIKLINVSKVDNNILWNGKKRLFF